MKITRSKIACEFSCERLCGNGFGYLWTFTFKELLPINVACELWQNLARDLVRKLGVFGLRVFELHPGGHGLHIHLLTCARFDVCQVRKLSDFHGFGRINVVKIPCDACTYVAKYVSKSHSERDAVLKGRRLWQPVGKRFWPVSPSRVSDIDFLTCENDIFQKLTGGNQVSLRRSLQYRRVAQLLTAGYFSLVNNWSGLCFSPHPSLFSFFPDLRYSYSYPAIPATYVFDDLLHDVAASTDN